MSTISSLPIFIIFLILPIDTCIPTQQAETEPITTTTTTTASPYVCPVCKKIYGLACTKLTSTSYCVSSDDASVVYHLGQLSDGYGNAETCYINVACPSATKAVYTITGTGTVSFVGNLTATCSETDGTWYYEESTTQVVTNVVCQGTTT